ncbi:MAG: XRE family transcriptional regulator [Thermoleophilia bacterium]|nr:XRE family transcriptional regulator [Thermoleophilia bacterium]
MTHTHTKHVEIDHLVSGGNIFADLEIPGATDVLAKAELARQIAGIAGRRRLTQAQIARILGTTQPKVSDLFAGKLSGFSLERLLRFLNALDRDVLIVVSPKPRERRNAITAVTASGPES